MFHANIPSRQVCIRLACNIRSPAAHLLQTKGQLISGSGIFILIINHHTILPLSCVPMECADNIINNIQYIIIVNGILTCTISQVITVNIYMMAYQYTCALEFIIIMQTVDPGMQINIYSDILIIINHVHIILNN